MDTVIPDVDFTEHVMHWRWCFYAFSSFGLPFSGPFIGRQGGTCMRNGYCKRAWCLCALVLQEPAVHRSVWSYCSKHPSPYLECHLLRGRPSHQLKHRSSNSMGGKQEPIYRHGATVDLYLKCCDPQMRGVLWYLFGVQGIGFVIFAVTF